MQFILAGLSVQAQPFPYAKDYFRNPVGIPMELSANFGELRPNHWHMGLDIRTNAKENLPIYAAAAGYIAKVGIRPQSFGRFIIINHPNGLSTLYGHLNDFYPRLEEYVTNQQYKLESWAVELDFSKNQFPVSKGQFIAYSGNTGGSRGPHLHFEIMETSTTRRLNPLLFNFPLNDNMPPSLTRLALYDRSRSVYDQTPFFFSLKNTDSGYMIPKNAVIKTGLSKISFALQMFDKSNGGGSDNGVYGVKLFLDDEPQVDFELDSIDYNETAYINAHIDYRHDYNGGAYLQHISQLPGERSGIYKQYKGDGVIELNDTLIHYISIDVKDANNNTSQLYFAVQYNDSLAALLPQRATLAKLGPNQPNAIVKNDFEINLPEGCLYDSVPAYYYRDEASAYYAVTAKHQVNDPSYPVHDDLTVRIKPNKTIPADWKNKLLIIKSGKGNSIRKAKWDNEWLSAKFGDFGSFQAFADVAPPSINSLGSGDTVNLSKASRIFFTPTDNYGIAKFDVVVYACPSDSTGFLCDSLLDYKWLRFTNDKSRNWIYTFDSRVPYGVYKLKATAEDLVGNITTREWWFKRSAYTPPPPKKKVVKKAAKKADEKKKKETKKAKTTTTKKTVSKKKN